MPSPANTAVSLVDPFLFTEAQPEANPGPLTAELWGAVDTYQRSIERQLERHLSGRDTSAWPSLLLAMDSLQGWHEQCREQVLGLLARPAVATPTQNVPAAYRQSNLSGALAEAQVQRLLGALTESEFTAIERSLERLLDHQELPQGYQFGQLALADGENRTTWHGALVLSTFNELARLPTSPRVLLYRFGVHGGWSAHASSEALLGVAGTALGALASQQVTLEAAEHTAFDDTLNARVAALTVPAGSGPRDRETRERFALEALDELTVPVNPARLLALARVEETRRSLRLGEEAHTWLTRLSPQVRHQLARLITDYAAAMVASEQLLQRDLPARDAYTATQVNELLVSRFGLSEPCRVRLKLPLQVHLVKEPVAGSGAPGTPVKQVPRPSRDTEVLPLEALALGQIDDALAERLAFLEVQVSPPHHPQQQALAAGIDAAWLRRAMPELDVAGTYERLLADAYLRAGQFRGAADEDEAVLARPFALMLEMQWVIARQQGRLDAHGVLMAERACHATRQDAWQAGGMDLTLRPAALTLFDERTHSSGSTLAGVTFVHDRVSDNTLLYLPEAPDGRMFRQYPTLAKAIEALADLFVDQRLRRYLCERAVEGDPGRLENLVDQALIRGYRNLVSAREPWPAHQSLTRNQYLANLGLRVRAHRATSTSRADQVFHNARQSGVEAVRWIRIALGFIPFVGSAIALVDAVEAGIEAGHAFSAGDSVRGLEATESVLLSIVDALFDFGPAALVSGAGTASLVATTRARQLRHGLEGAGRLRQLSSWSARRAEEAFSGYESGTMLTVTPGTEGRWRNVYREPDGNFIARGSHTYAVLWDENHRTWRLAPTLTRGYRQPVALDETGRWQTHGQLYGSLVNGGLRGGGGVQSYIADRLDPLWPDTLRRMLPRWWTDAHFRRQQQLLSERATRWNAIVEHEQAGTRTLEAYKRGEATLQETLDATNRTIASALALNETLEQYRAVTRGRRFTQSGVDQSRVAATICAKSQLQIKLSFVESERLTELAVRQREDLRRLIQAVRDDDTINSPLIEPLLVKFRDIRQTLAGLLEQYDRMEQSLERLRLWERRVSSAEHRRTLHPETQNISRVLAQEPVTLLRVSLLMDLAPTNELGQASWAYMRRLFSPARKRFDRVAQSAFTGEALNLQPQQRQRLKSQLKEQSQAFIRVLRRLLASYPEQFDPALSERLLEELRKLHDGLPVQPMRPEAVSGRVRPRVFEGDGLLLVGDPIPNEPDVLVIPRVDNRPERWTRGIDQNWIPAEPVTTAPIASPLPMLVRHAEDRLGQLPALRRRLQRYANQRTLPADLEDLYLGESQELEYRIRQLREADPNNNQAALIERLQQEAERLREEGRQARIQHSKTSSSPSGGHLEYLLEAGEVRIRRVGTLQRSGARPAIRNWLQEYEILDLRNGQPLCYAHFHYAVEQPRFGDFVAAHLKTPAQRFQAASAPGEPAIWRGEISRRLANRVFQPLFQ
ncbi:DUF6543 domain-containing protein [Pseudomonas sp. RIT-PI-S]|uniref:dermonecrotic toxin domain-containing protein n=1 Tax=Pseudomonas sp. RIT-PI-S TaxID=3035295 RepID=UPI0021D89194|nr:DUF6543 domain-containing protein [Pseudomonas sp. RIT-PI-S]